MATGSVSDPKRAAQIAVVRAFNRFYTAKLGLLRKRHLDSEFSLTEGRLLYEIGASPRITASTLRSALALDAGYISRLLTSLTRRKFVRQAPSIADGREKLLTLTAKGRKAVARLNRLSDLQVETMLSSISPAGRDAFVNALTHAHSILRAPQASSIKIVRLTQPNTAALEILEEYYEAVHVVQRDNPESIDKIVCGRGSGLWLATLRDEVVGCVMLRRLASIPHAAECKRLYVKPAARGNRIAGQLLDAMEAFALQHGYKWIYLDTYHDLNTAIALYERRGYQACTRYNNNPQATLFMRKRIAS
jgi:DNA-binding MarR family transcriptional regulator/GNAT superfamily N-acetyltransferase